MNSPLRDKYNSIDDLVYEYKENKMYNVELVATKDLKIGDYVDTHGYGWATIESIHHITENLMSIGFENGYAIKYMRNHPLKVRVPIIRTYQDFYSEMRSSDRTSVNSYELESKAWENAYLSITTKHMVDELGYDSLFITRERVLVENDYVSLSTMKAMLNDYRLYAMYSPHIARLVESLKKAIYIASKPETMHSDDCNECEVCGMMINPDETHYVYQKSVDHFTCDGQ